MWRFLRRRFPALWAWLPLVCLFAAGDEPEIAPEVLPAAPARSAEQVREIQQRWRALIRGVFEREFQAARELSVEQRLMRAADVTASLRSKAEAASADLLDEDGIEASTRARIFLRHSDLMRLLAARPWLREYQAHPEDRRIFIETIDYVWPTGADAADLRKLVRSRDYDVSAMAIEALATLDVPEDVTQIAQVLHQRLPVVDVLQPSETTSHALDFPPVARAFEENPLELEQHWRDASLRDYALRALRRMTGYDFERTAYYTWAAKYGTNRDSFWYWQQRLFHAFDHTTLQLFAEQPRVANYKLWLEKSEVVRRAMRERFECELAERDPEVEAKVRLLAGPPYIVGPEVTESGDRYFDLPAKLRLTPDRFLRLIERRGLWTDVDWETADGRSNEFYGRMVSRIALSAEYLLRPQDAPALLELMPRSWSYRSAAILGASRLLLPADPLKLDDVATRDGFLRQALRTEQDENVCGYVARELVRLDVVKHAPLLEWHFFAEYKTDDLQVSILRALGERPLTAEKLDLLVKLTSDPRLTPLLIQPNTVAGKDKYRLWAAWALNAHAGKEVLDYARLPDLAQREGFAKTWKRIVQEVRQLAEQRRKASAMP